MQNNLPLVSIPVITYNSSKTVVETLDSIYAQTYPNIELIVSDDCSSDKTMEIVRDWVAKHKERFVRTKLITAEKNTGISANLNRAEAACHGEWIKSIAGDDLLLEDCIESCINYVNRHNDVVVLFGRQEAFGSDKDSCQVIDATFDYQMFRKPVEEQLHKLLFEGNCIPATTLFYHRECISAIGVKNDERITFLEDWPKWINLLRAGVRFYFIDKTLVKYRIGGISTSNKYALQYYKAHRLMCFYYQYPEWCKEDMDAAITRVVRDEMDIYMTMKKLETSLHNVYQSRAYRLGTSLLKPIKFFKSLVASKQKSDNAQSF